MSGVFILYVTHGRYIGAIGRSNSTRVERYRHTYTFGVLEQLVGVTSHVWRYKHMVISSATSYLCAKGEAIQDD